MKTVYSLVRFVFRAAAWVLVTLAVSVILLLLFGIYPYAVKTGSMEPAIAAGSVCFVNSHTAFDDICEGDIIAFEVGEMLVTHRAVKVETDSIVTKGDANNTEDTKEITQEDYLGKVIFSIPHIGKFLLFLHTKKGKIICVDLIVFIVLFDVADACFNKLRAGADSEVYDMDDTPL